MKTEPTGECPTPEQAKTYEDTAQKLADRIAALIPSNPGILKMEMPWELFNLPDFDASDLDPSFGQACWALGNAQKRFQNSSC